MLRQCIIAGHHQIIAGRCLAPFSLKSRLPFMLIRNFAAASTPKGSDGGGALEAARERNDVSTDVKPIGERIKENTKTASYMGVIILGVTVTSALMFAIFRELWCSTSPNNVYSVALERCIEVSFSTITFFFSTKK